MVTTNLPLVIRSLTAAVSRFRRMQVVLLQSCVLLLLLPLLLQRWSVVRVLVVLFPLVLLVLVPLVLLLLVPKPMLITYVHLLPTVVLQVTIVLLALQKLLVLLVLLIRVLLHVLLDLTVPQETLVFVPLVAPTLMLQQLV